MIIRSGKVIVVISCGGNLESIVGGGGGCGGWMRRWCSVLIYGDMN